MYNSAQKPQVHSLISFHIRVSCVSTTQTRTQNVPSSWVMGVSPLGSPASFPSPLHPSSCSWALSTFSSDLWRLPGAYRAPDIFSLIAKAYPSNARTSHPCLRCQRPAPCPTLLSRLAVICAVRPPPYFKVSSSFAGSSQNQGLALPLCDLPPSS